MIVISVTPSMYAFGLRAEHKNQSPIFHSILKLFNPLIGFLAVALLMLILFPLLVFAALIFWTLFMVEALIKAFQEFFFMASSCQTQIMESYFDRRRREQNGSTILVGKELKCCLSEVDLVLHLVDLLL